MPRPLPPLPPTLRELEEQHREARRRLALAVEPIRSRPYDWRRDGL
jgi:hypothetical protein